MSYKPRAKTLRKLIQYLGKELHIPLSTDDTLYLKWKAERELFRREMENWKADLWSMWCLKYMVLFNGKYYQKGQLVKADHIKTS